MLSLSDPRSMWAALKAPLDPDLHCLLSERIQDAVDTDLLQMTHFLVVEPDDSEDAIQQAICLSPLVNPLDGVRYGSPCFHPFWDWLEDLGGFFEMVIAVGNGGFAFILLIRDAPEAESELLSLCREYAQ